MLSPNIFNTVFVFPILNLLIAIYKGLLFLKIPGAFGLAIILLVGLVRALFHPFFKKQMETAHKMQQLKPHLDKLSVKHKADPKKLQQEQMRLYQEAGINSASGCLFMLIQIPIFIALYRTLALFFTVAPAAKSTVKPVVSAASLAKVIASINKVLYLPALHISTIDTHFFGFNLATSPAQAHVWYYYAIPLVTGVMQYFQVTTSTPPTAAALATKDDGKDKDKDKKGGDTEDFQKAMTTQMKYIFPVMIGYFSYTLPVGLSLYWNVFSIFSIIQNKRINPNAHLIDIKT